MHGHHQVVSRGMEEDRAPWTARFLNEDLPNPGQCDDQGHCGEASGEAVQYAFDGYSDQVKMAETIASAMKLIRKARFSPRRSGWERLALSL